MHIHSFIPSIHEGYEVCSGCGSYHSTALATKESLYLGGKYWDGTTRSLMKDQVHNLTETDSAGISKIDAILQYVDEPGDVLEIGCAPGILMRKLIEKGCTVTGIEPDKENIPEIFELCGAVPTIIEGFFPDCLKGRNLWPVQYVIAMDVMEHVDDYRGFFKGVWESLLPGGRFIIMSPIILNDGKYRLKDIIAHEHAWIFTQQFLEEFLLGRFREVKFSRPFIVGHEVVTAIK